MFNPRNENTYNEASSCKTAVIDGIQIFESIWENNIEIKHFLTEKQLVDRINYFAKFSDLPRQEYINKEIQTYINLCKDISIKKSDLVISGYAYSIAQKEMMKYLTLDEKEKLTDIIINHFKNKRQKYRLRQDIFDNLAGKIDNYLFTDLCYAIDVDTEKEIMQEYYSGFDSIETKDDLNNLLNNDYLNLYPDLQNELSSYFLNNFNL